MQERRNFVRLGVGGRLLLAFLAIGMFWLIGVAAGLFSLSQLGRSLSTISDVRVPQALSWLELSRQAERVVRAAPALLLVTNEDARVKVSADIAAQAAEHNKLVGDIGTYAGGDEARSGASVRPLVEHLNANLAALEDLVKQRLAVADKMAGRIRQLAQVSVTAQSLISPGARTLEAQLAEWGRSPDAADSGPLSAERSADARSIIGLMPQENARGLIDAVHNTLLTITTVENPTEIDVLSFPLKKSLGQLSDISQSVPDQIKSRLVQQINLLTALGIGPISIAEIRKDELAILAQAKALLAVNAQLSADLTNEVSRQVAEANADIVDARSQAASLQAVTRTVLLVVGILSLVSSGLIGWLYVQRNLVRRLTALSDSMLAIAGGNLRAPLPASGGGDEISRMAEALIVFRDTAIEVEESNLRDVESARRRLVDAIENSSEGFAFYDAEDRLVICNTKYPEMLYPGADWSFDPGLEFATILRKAAEKGLAVGAKDRINEWVAERLTLRRNPGKPRLQQRQDGRWIQITERRTKDGGTVCVSSDVTDLKQREEELTKARDAAEGASRAIEAAYGELKATQANLIQSEKLASLGQLTAGIAHEIKNPLNFVNIFSALSRELIGELGEALARATMEKAQREEADELIGTIAANLDKVVSHGKRADSIVKNMLLHSREGSGERTSVNVNAMVEEALNLAYHGARAERPGFNVTIAQSLDDKAGAADIYAQEMTRVLLNLISNAFYATMKRKQGGSNGAYEPTVIASTHDLGTSVEIAIRDNGTGVPDEVKAKMFNPFFTTKPAGEGTGLGLSLSHDIVVKHGGTLEVSTEPGSYTQFTIVLPRAGAGA